MRKISVKFCYVIIFSTVVALCFTSNMFAQSILLGMTPNGGPTNGGVVYNSNLSGTAYNATLFAGNSTPNGAIPYGGLMQASNGNFYGLVTSDSSNFGSPAGNGYLIQYNPSTGTITNLFNFTGVTGAYPGSKPYGNLIEVGGKLFGMTSEGGSIDKGVAFSYDLGGTNAYTVLHNFTYGFNGGYNPKGTLLKASDGNLYGLTTFGGASNNGTIFKITPSGVYTQLVDFTGTTGIAIGSQPRFSSLIEPIPNKLYGMTERGGVNNQGVIFEYDIISGSYSLKYSFSNNTAGVYYPRGSLMKANNGKLYGLCGSGGNNTGAGGMFEYDLNGAGSYSGIYNLGSQTGGGPQGSFIQASDGYLYATVNSGLLGYGGIIKFDYTTNLPIVVLSFSGFNGTTQGSYPTGDLLEYNPCVPLTPDSIVGERKYCMSGSSLTYSVPPVSGATSYTWSLPNGWTGTSTTNTISVMPNGTDGFINVTANNSCGTSRISSVYVQVGTPLAPTVSILETTALGAGVNVTFGGIASSSSNYGGNNPQDAFDGDTIYLGWGSGSGVLPEWLEYDFGSANGKVINEYSFYCSPLMSGGWGSTGYLPTAWTFEGYNGSTWDILDSQTNSNPQFDVWNSYSFANTTSYEKYRIQISNAGTAYVIITELRLFTKSINPCSAREFTASVNSVANPATYQWSINGINVGGNNPTISLPYAFTNDVVTCNISTNNTCATSNSVNSNQFIIAQGNVLGQWVDSTICSGQSVTINSIVYTNPGIFVTSSLPAVTGCDSLNILRLTVNPLPDNSVTANSTTLTANATGVTYQWIDCNNGNAAIAGETNQSFTATSTGNYAVIVTQGLCSDTSTCFAVSTVGIKNNLNDNGISLMPNPNNGTFTIKSTREGTYAIVTELGQIVETIKTNAINNYSVSITDLQAGIYYIVGIDNGARQKIVVTN